MRLSPIPISRQKEQEMSPLSIRARSSISSPPSDSSFVRITIRVPPLRERRERGESRVGMRLARRQLRRRDQLGVAGGRRGPRAIVAPTT